MRLGFLLHACMLDRPSLDWSRRSAWDRISPRPPLKLRSGVELPRHGRHVSRPLPSRARTAVRVRPLAAPVRFHRTRPCLIACYAAGSTHGLQPGARPRLASPTADAQRVQPSPVSARRPHPGDSPRAAATRNKTRPSTNKLTRSRTVSGRGDGRRQQRPTPTPSVRPCQERGKKISKPADYRKVSYPSPSHEGGPATTGGKSKPPGSHWPDRCQVGAPWRTRPPTLSRYRHHRLRHQ